MEDEEKQGVDLENDDEFGSSDEENLDSSDNHDPLDDIDDIEELRSRAKEERSKRQRISKKVSSKKESAEKPSTAVSEKKFVTKDDYYRGNERKATRELTVVTEDDSEQSAEFKKDLKANWKNVMRYYRDISGRETVEDIVDDITDAYNAFRRRNPKKSGDEAKEAASILSQSKGRGGKTPSSDGRPRKKSILRRRKSVGADQMLGWYPEE